MIEEIKKLSEASNHTPGEYYQITGRIKGFPIHKDTYGGRYFVSIADIDDLETGATSQAKLVLNLNPEQNPALPRGIKKPLLSIKSLFAEPKFLPLFKINSIFRAQAVLGFSDGHPWFNVFHMINFEPSIYIGKSQIMYEPSCDREIMLNWRKIEQNRISEDTGSHIVGSLVHEYFQQIATSPSSEREQRIDEIKSDPEKFFVKYLPKEIALKVALAKIYGQFGESVFETAKRDINSLISSPSVIKLLGNDSWESERPVNSQSIDGRIDLRTQNKIVEIKTGQEQREKHALQTELYLIGDMIEYGTKQVIDGKHRGYVIYSSSKIEVDNLRVSDVKKPEEILIDLLNKFIYSRHNYLLASQLTIPKIEIPQKTCEDKNCKFLKTFDDRPSACHFYCQTDRSWECSGCLHRDSCDQSFNYHAHEVLDNANQIRLALKDEIEIYRQELNFQSKEEEWKENFILTEIQPGGLLQLKPDFEEIDPPKYGARVKLQFESSGSSLFGEVIQNGFEDDQWLICVKGVVGGLEIKTGCTVIEERGRLEKVFHLLSCIDKLQRRKNSALSEKGIAFAGGKVVSSDIPTVLNVSQIKGHRDVFCQSFSIHDSKKYLKELIDHSSKKILVVTEQPKLDIPNSINLIGKEFQKSLQVGGDIKMVIKNLVKTLGEKNIWIVPPGFLFSEVLDYLPKNGRDFFDQLIIYEVQTITSLEYLLVRELGKQTIVIGDANLVGRPMSSHLSLGMSLGDNILKRITSSGFPKFNDDSAVVFNRKEQNIFPQLNEALHNCRMESLKPEDTNERGKIQFIAHQKDPKSSQDLFLDDILVPVKGEMEKKVKIKPLQPCIRDEIEVDLNSISFKTDISCDDTLTSPLSGRSYQVLTHLEPLENGTEGEWCVSVQYGYSHSSTSNLYEVEKIKNLVKELLQKGSKPKNIAILSSYPKQLKEISKKLGNSSGINFRTPYNIGGDSWGTVVISCVRDSLDTHDKVVDPRVMYSMIRPALQKVFVVGHENYIKNHPFLRHLNASEVGVVQTN